MADESPPPARRRSVVLPLAAISAVLAVAVVALLVLVLTRPGPASTAATPTPTPTTAPGASPTPGTAGEPASSVDQAQQHQQYRAYVSTVVQNGTAVVAGVMGLAGCRDGKPQCLARLNDASQQVNNMQDALQANPAPPCLSAEDAQLQDSLTFQMKGLNMAHDALLSQNRLQLMQGLLLTAAGLYRGGQAIMSGRRADC